MNTRESSLRNPFEKILKKKADKKPNVEIPLKDIVYEFLDSDSDENADKQALQPIDGEKLGKKLDEKLIEDEKLDNKPIDSAAPKETGSKTSIREIKTANESNKLRTIKEGSTNPKKFKFIDPDVNNIRQELPTPILPKYQRVYGSDGDYLERKHNLKKRKMNNENKIVLDNKKYILSIDTHKAIRNYTDTELAERHDKADKNLANSWKSIISKYEKLGKDQALSDVVDLKTGTIIVDNGHLKGLNQQDTLKRTEDRNYNVLGRIKNSYDDDFLDLLSSENVINEAKKKDIDVMDLKERGILKGLNLNLELTMSDLDTDEEADGDEDESFHLNSDDEILSEAETIESQSASDIEVDDEIEESFD